MYCNFFGFSERPFDLTPDPKFLYLSHCHVEMLAALTYGIHQRRGFITMVGEVGTGKTLLLNTILDRLDKNTKVAYIFNTDLTFRQMLITALVDLGLLKSVNKLSKDRALQRLNDFAIRQLPLGGNVVLIVDEAQNLKQRSMENLRLISNLETRKHKLVQIVLSGQPELDTKLNQPELRQLAQRISLKRYITALNEKETYEYIHHRLRIANYKGPSLFNRRTQQLIWEYTEGVPRKINVLCDNALLIGYGLKKKKIDTDVVKEAINDLSWSPYSRTIETQAAITIEQQAPQLKRSTSRRRLALAAILVLAASLILFVVLFFGNPHLKLQKWGSFLPHTLLRALPAREPESTDQSSTSVGDYLYNLQNPDGMSVQTEKEGSSVNPEAVAGERDDALPDQARVVIANPGDSLFSIIIRTYGKYDGAILNSVLNENPELLSPDKIPAGQAIKIPKFD
jgi:general secretion pathway protein A